MIVPPSSARQFGGTRPRSAGPSHSGGPARSSTRRGSRPPPPRSERTQIAECPVPQSANRRCDHRGIEWYAVLADVHSRYAEPHTVESTRSRAMHRLREDLLRAAQGYAGLLSPEVTGADRVVDRQHIEQDQQILDRTGMRHNHIAGRTQRPIAADRQHTPGRV